MKKLIILTSLVTATCAFSQTNAPSTNTQITLPLVQIGLTTNQVTVANDVFKWISPLIPYLTNKSITLQTAGVYEGGKIGEFADLQVPITEGLSMGVGETYINSHWYAEAVSTKVGTPLTLPVINWKCYAFAETGLCVGVKDASVGNESLAGITKTWDIGSKVNLITEGGTGFITQESKNFYFGSIAINYHW